MSIVDLPELEILYKDIFVMRYLYIMIHHWLLEENYTDPDQLSTELGYHEYIEKLYFQRNGTPRGAAERELRLWWRLMKMPGAPPLGSSPYYKHYLNINFQVFNMRDVEIVREGRKMKVQYGEIILKLKAWIVTDPGGEWSKHWLLKYIQPYFERRLYRRDMELHKKNVYRDLYRLHGFIKKYLELQTFIPELREFHEKFETL